MERCPHCSFDPTSSGDFCEKHRPSKTAFDWAVDVLGGESRVSPEEIAAGWPVLRPGTPWESMIPKDEVFKGHINLSSGAIVMGEFVHASLARLLAQEVERLAAKVATIKEEVREYRLRCTACNEVYPLNEEHMCKCKYNNRPGCCCAVCRPDL